MGFYKSIGSRLMHEMVNQRLQIPAATGGTKTNLKETVSSMESSGGSMILIEVALTHDFAKLSSKMHAIEKILGRSGTRDGGAPPPWNLTP